MLLDHVQQAASSWLGYAVKINSIPQTKFVQPLLPEQNAEIQLRLTGTELRFSIVRDDSTLATGVLAKVEESTDAMALDTSCRLAVPYPTETTAESTVATGRSSKSAVTADPASTVTVRDCDE